MAMIGDFTRNKIVDFLLRAQTYTPPATHYVGLMTTNATHTVGSGTEVSGGSYARVAITASMTATGWAGTQSAGSTTASSGSGASAVTSNNGTITFPAPTANWGIVTGWTIWDASTSGQMMYFGPLSVSKTINNGDAAPSFASGALALTFDT
jgi:hypothetical protein